MNALTTQARGYLPAPQSMADAMRLAELLAQSTMVPQTYRGKPGDILVAIQMGAELGLAPLQALQNIASINGRPAVWGDAALALVQKSPAYVSHREWVEGEGEDRAGYCAITRRGSGEHVQRFSMRDAKRANLLGKQGPWQQYTERMLVLRARGFALRDKFADALRGLITAEEAQDIPAEPTSVVGVVVSNQPLLAAMQAPADATLPLIGPDGVTYDIGARGDSPAVFRWLSAARKAIGKLEDLPALRGWEAAMRQNFDAIRQTEPEAVEAVERAIGAREDALMVSSDTVEREPGEEG